MHADRWCSLGPHKVLVEQGIEPHTGPVGTENGNTTVLTQKAGGLRLQVQWPPCAEKCRLFGSIKMGPHRRSTPGAYENNFFVHGWRLGTLRLLRQLLWRLSKATGCRDHCSVVSRSDESSFDGWCWNSFFGELPRPIPRPAVEAAVLVGELLVAVAHVKGPVKDAAPDALLGGVGERRAQ